ncbi:MAG: pyridoxal-phosphate dependent enzyme [Chloroflexota bacterium]
METLFNAVHCAECGQELEATLYPGNCPECGSQWLNAEYDLHGLPENWPEIVANRPTSQWRYGELLPFSEDITPVTMGEGWTPLTRAENLQTEYNHAEVWIKDERQQPTGSFKDRQAASTVTALKAMGINEIVIASAGNAAAAYAAFCARAGIKLWVFLTNSVPAEKMRELSLYGAEVVKVTATYDQAKHISAQFARHRGIFLDRGAKAIPNKESMKTMAFEIVEQLGWKAPDWYIQAVSGGLGPLGALKGFEELKIAGIIDKVPKMGIVQVEGCAPMVRAWEQGLAKAEPVIPDTLISVLATGDPGVAYEILKEGIDIHGGAMVSVDDGDTFRAMRRVARMEGYSTEPATSAAFAGFEKLLAEGYIGKDETVVINCSGHTFSAEKHALEDRYVIELNLDHGHLNEAMPADLAIALNQIDEKVTTIVIIDDNPQDCRLIRRLLHRYKNYRIFEAYNSKDGIDLVRQQHPELVILDLVLGDTDGFSILEDLKRDARTHEVPVMIVSGKDLTSDQEDFLDRNTHSVWQKGSFSGRQLVDYVVDVLGDEAAEIVVTESIDNFSDIQPLTKFGISDRPKILVIDDNIWDSRLVRRMFETRQLFDVIEAHSAEEGMHIANSGIPDLIILDLVLPDISGEEVLELLHEHANTANIPVVIVSGKDLEPEERAKLKIHADSVWSKGSLDRNNLLSHIETILTE